MMLAKKSYGFLFLLVTTVFFDSSIIHANNESLKKPLVFLQKSESVTLSNAVSVSGTIEASQNVNLSFRLPGVLSPYIPEGSDCKNDNKHKSIDIADDNQTVQQGDCLAALSTTNIDTEIDQLQKKVEIYKASYLRNKKLAAAKHVSQQVLEQSELNYRRAETDLDLQKNNKMHKMIIRAPFSGKLGERKIDPGTSISPFTAVFNVYSPDALEVNVLLTAEQSSKIQPGSGCKIALSSKPSTTVIKGTVDSISGEALPNTELFPVNLFVSTQDHNLKPGMLVDIRIFPKAADAKLTVQRIPYSALFPPEPDQDNGLTMRHSLGSASVFVYDPKSHVVDQKHVKVYKIDNKYAYIEHGLPAGASVVYAGEMIRSGMQVQAEYRT
jgi:membrane fusion protein, multidrug efflux system